MKKCSVDGCNGAHKAKGFCNKHYQQVKVHGKILEPNRCQVDGCTGKYCAHGWCETHYAQMRVHGKILDRTKNSPNEFSIDGNICTIQIYDNKSRPKCQVVIDVEDYDMIKQFKWYSDTKTKMITNNQIGFLSRFIMGVSDPQLLVDHINHDRLDNRKENLRVCIHAENIRNQLTRSTNTSGYKGVTWHKKYKRWQAQIGYNGKVITIGRFKNKKDAALAYNKKALELFGEFAYLNDVE
jgi:hypothetical protein